MKQGDLVFLLALYAAVRGHLAVVQAPPIKHNLSALNLLNIGRCQNGVALVNDGIAIDVAHHDIMVGGKHIKVVPINGVAF